MLPGVYILASQKNPAPRSKILPKTSIYAYRPSDMIFYESELNISLVLLASITNID